MCGATWWALRGQNALVLQIDVVENGPDKRQPPRVVDPEGKKKASRVDRVCRRIFPASFMLFNIVYWIVYTVPFSR